ncbi:hypothetical protein M1B72_13560 [Geomonas paludis]|uniref:Uncharacterized protein n=1 Tax=Geomonas paludis TaxID=2740185 RepID=A0A6V8MXA3_9BACT|nr:hypothetical protein [Geomonas paludis]UPU34476.1 hypothetical protein M1B72_13560 [Geomonas paludis]GFO64464.1 hypothetical protein GMPD_23830 [Geomonas paludis]
MDDRFFSVKAAAKRVAEINLQKTSFLTLEVKFLRLQTAMLNHSLAPRLRAEDSAFDHLTLLVEEMAAAREPHFWYEALSEHLEEMIAAVEGQPAEISQ